MLEKNIAIEFNGVGKQYRLGRVGTGTLAHDLNRWWQTSVLRREDPYLKIGEVNDRSVKGHSDYVWALKDISFKVEQGDVVGIIGKNGAGKSTLLKLLSHITAPTTGTIGYNGRIASLLEVGTGFHPEMTARENIYMNGSIMGMTRHEITSKLDEIVDFAGIERYLDTPVKRFSSGMTVRLGFAVAAFLEPEILVVDEVLAVGDAEFQKKAIGKMKDVSSQGGRTVLFVSHNMTAIKSLCKNAILLENGLLQSQGDTDSIVSKYLRGNNGLTNYKTWDKPEIISDGFELLEIGVKCLKGTYTDPMKMDQDNEVAIKYKLTHSFEEIHIVLVYKNDQGHILFTSCAHISEVRRQHDIGTYKQKSIIPANFLNCGTYSLDLYVIYDNVKTLFHEDDIVSFNLNSKIIELGGWMSKEPGDITPHFNFTETKL